MPAILCALKSVRRIPTVDGLSVADSEALGCHCSCSHFTSSRIITCDVGHRRSVERKLAEIEGALAELRSIWTLL